jgi:glycine cleavage system H protein
MSEEPYELKDDKWTFRVHRDRYYTENDSWVKVEGEIATVGITDFLQNNVGDVMYVECYKIGRAIEQFDEVATFDSVKTMVEVISPVAGTIIETNSRLVSEPELANKDPYGEGWFVKIKVKDFDSDKGNLLGPGEYYESLKVKVEAERLKVKKKREEG